MTRGQLIPVPCHAMPPRAAELALQVRCREGVLWTLVLSQALAKQLPVVPNQLLQHPGVGHHHLRDSGTVQPTLSS